MSFANRPDPDQVPKVDFAKIDKTQGELKRMSDDDLMDWEDEYKKELVVHKKRASMVSSTEWATEAGKMKEIYNTYRLSFNRNWTPCDPFSNGVNLSGN